MSVPWVDANQRYLTRALALVRARLERADAERIEAARLDLEEARSALPSDAALELVESSFGLSPFERDVLLLAAGVELDGAFAAACAKAQGEPRRTQPSFSLALAMLPEPHWSALSPAGPLRRFRLVELGPGDVLTQRALQVDERILHFLAGVQHVDERLIGVLEPLRPGAELSPSQQRVADDVAALLARSSNGAALPIIELTGAERGAKRAVAAEVARRIGLRLDVLSGFAAPGCPDEQLLLTLLLREAILGGAALFVDAEDLDGADPTRLAALRRLCERSVAPTFVAVRERLRLTQRNAACFEVRRPIAEEQRELWARALGEGSPASAADPALPALLAGQFDLGTIALRGIAASVAPDAPNARDALWTACRVEARPRLDDLAQRIDAHVGWDDLVLPRAQLDTLREIAGQVRNRARVHEQWGFEGRAARGLGINVLFAGVSGTGKTMAAEVLAHELRLDLYRIDLSQVVSKYIGETEKNLRRVFDAAEEGAAILLFDEADALFGKRSEIKDSHDRYANIEVSYLLQRMETYRGLSVLTTNLKSSLDTAFLRRLRFVVQFPFPTPNERAEIWRRVFPAQTPLDGLDLHALARLNVAGGNIRSIALNAAFLAADAGTSVRMDHVLRAAQAEYAKLERVMTEM